MTVAVVKTPHPGRSKSPSLLTGQEISHLVTVQPIVEAAHPGPGSKVSQSHLCQSRSFLFPACM